MVGDDIHSNTGPCCWYREGTTIVDNAEANNPRVRVACPELMMGTK